MAEFTSKWLKFGADTGHHAADKTDRKPRLIAVSDPCPECGSRLRRGGRCGGYCETPVCRACLCDRYIVRQDQGCPVCDGTMCSICGAACEQQRPGDESRLVVAVEPP